MELNLNRLQELYEQEENITHAAKKYCKENNLEYTDNFRRKVSNKLHKIGAIDDDIDNGTETKTNQYKSDGVSLMPSAWCIEKQRFYTIEEFCDVYGLDIKTVKSSKLVSHNASHMTYNIAFFTDEEEAVIDVDKHLDEIVSKYIKPIKVPYKLNSHNDSSWFDRLVFTDVHIGMDVNGKDGDSLYEGRWDKEEVMRRLSLMVSHVLEFQQSSLLVIDDLGDFLDGLGGHTTRKGHELPQNMSDKESFDLALEFKISLVDSLIENYDEIIFNNITNDNHSGIFAYFVSSAFKEIIKNRYPEKVTVNTIKKFIEHYSIGNHTFIISHGKDVGEQKFGLKPHLDSKQIEKIDQYCKEHKLYNGKFIEFSKGDSHQSIYDDTTSNDFSYYNYPAFSPPSNWVKTNFKNSKSGFNFFNIHKDRNLKFPKPFWF